MTFDLIKMFMNQGENEVLVDFLFEDDTENLLKKKQGLGLGDRSMTKGEKILKAFGLPIDMTYEDFFSMHQEMHKYGDLIDKNFDIPKQALLADVIDAVLNIAHKDDFIFSEKYKVVASFDSTHGKWSNMIKDSVFLDCKQFHTIYV